MTRSALGSCLAIAAVVTSSVAVLGCHGRVRSSVMQSGHDSDRRTGPTIAVFDLGDGVPEQSPSSFLGLPSSSASLEDLVRAADEVERDKNVRGVLVRLRTSRVGLGRAEEVGALLARVAGKVPVWCHADDYSNGTMALAARGCKRIWVSPATSVDTIGIAAQTIYFHKLLVDRLGLDVDFLQVGRFKGAEEPFTRDGPSPEARQSLESTLGDIRAVWIDGIRTARPEVTETSVENGPYTADEARARHLVDDVGYYDEARDALEKATGAVRAEIRLGAGATANPGDELAELFRALGGESMSSSPIVIVRAVGAISSEGGGGIGGAEGIVERRLSTTLNRLEHDDAVKAVVLRIDSPGGSALASDLLWHALTRIRAKKTLAVSIGDMAASGGYYLASSGTVIFANATSIVGSIGVVGGKIAADRALAHWGVHAETFAAKKGDPGAAARASYDSLLTPWDDATKERVLATMTGVYDLFLARVATGRGIPVERVAESAEGRIFSGRDAKARGLVDRIGGLVDAVAWARTTAGLPRDARVTVAGEATGLLAALADDEPRSSAPAIAARLAGLTPELAAFVDSVAPIVRGDSVACALAYGLILK
ncbi:MAG: S49 family peptidase [Polyangiaceae bacterium]|nr:S49 family peptidase [Polyangiaceae bacterium]